MWKPITIKFSSRVKPICDKCKRSLKIGEKVYKARNCCEYSSKSKYRCKKCYNSMWVK